VTALSFRILTAKLIYLLPSQSKVSRPNNVLIIMLKHRQNCCEFTDVSAVSQLETGFVDNIG